MTHRLLIIGNTSETYHVGSMFVRAAEALNFLFTNRDVNWKTCAPSMQHFWGRAFYKLAGKRALEWWSFNQKTASLIREFQPTLVLVTGIIPLAKDVFQASTQVGATIANYLTDSPWSPQNACASFTENLPQYDWVFSTKTSLISKFSDLGVKRVQFVPFAFDPVVHHVPPVSTETQDTIFPDVCLIGAADRDRIQLIKQFLPHFKGGVGLYGGYWDRDPQLKVFYRGIVLGERFCSTIHKAKINIGLVRQANGDGHSMRSYEIPACGGCGIYEDTPEHRALYQDYPDYGFFTSPQDLAEKCQWLLEHSEEREQMRQLGMKLVVTESNTYTARLKQILKWAS